ncbi:hypothetical protein [Cohnella abietis]|uniref:Uncharacterized protein n=1 Tax=Cohnella abietis TaxID=2507935 RepID=A0A3T1D225_9BACL|nr:hypothetical protein [Cohnella abietis]BBI32172.1 hypothetical protein KCTCHS21_15710 [Cohnella abietis]
MSYNWVLLIAHLVEMLEFVLQLVLLIAHLVEILEFVAQQGSTYSSFGGDTRIYLTTPSAATPAGY